jgi:hypothetical protein
MKETTSAWIKRIRKTNEESSSDWLERMRLEQARKRALILMRDFLAHAPKD